MPTFCPPVTDRVPTDYVGGNDRYYPAAAPLRRLMGRYLGSLRAPNVYKITAAYQATYDLPNLYVDDGPTGFGQPYDNPPGSAIDTVYYGSHCVPVTQAEADALTAAGYGAGIS
jgi:hypothetical protein